MCEQLMEQGIIVGFLERLEQWSLYHIAWQFHKDLGGKPDVPFQACPV